MHHRLKSRYSSTRIFAICTYGYRHGSGDIVFPLDRIAMESVSGLIHRYDHTERILPKDAMKHPSDHNFILSSHQNRVEVASMLRSLLRLRKDRAVFRIGRNSNQFDPSGLPRFFDRIRALPEEAAYA